MMLQNCNHSVETVLGILMLDLVPGQRCAVGPASLDAGQWATAQAASDHNLTTFSTHHHSVTFRAVLNTWCETVDPWWSNRLCAWWLTHLPEDPILWDVLWAWLRQARLCKLWCLVDQMWEMHCPQTLVLTSDGFMRSQPQRKLRKTGTRQASEYHSLPNNFTFILHAFTFLFFTWEAQLVKHERTLRPQKTFGIKS